MKKLLGLLGTIMITGNAIPSVIAAAPNRKHNIKKRQNNENISTTPKTQDDQNYELSTTSNNKVDIIEKEITLNENYSDNIQKMLQELIDENYIDPLRSINMGGLISKDLDNKTIISKLEELEPKMANWIKKQQNNKDKILILTLKNSNNKSIKLVINLNNFYLLGFINNQNQYFYFDDELLKRIEQNNQNEITELTDINADLEKFNKLTKEKNKNNTEKEELEELEWKIKEKLNKLKELDKLKEQVKLKKNPEEIKKNKNNIKNIDELIKEQINKAKDLNKLNKELIEARKSKLIEQINETNQKIEKLKEEILIPIPAINYNNDKKYLNNKIKNLQGEGLKTEEIKTKTLNTKVSEKYNYQKINLNYTGAYSEDGLDVVIKEKDKPTRGKDIILSKDTLNNAIVNLANYNNKQNENIKNDLVRLIFVTSEAMRFQCDEKTLEIFEKIRNIDKYGKIIYDAKNIKDIQEIFNADKTANFKKIIAESQNILKNIKEKIFNTNQTINWKDYTSQLRGDWKKYSEQLNKFRIELWEQLITKKKFFDFIDENQYEINKILEENNEINEKFKWETDYIINEKLKKLKKLFDKKENKNFKEFEYFLLKWWQNILENKKILNNSIYQMENVLINKTKIKNGNNFNLKKMEFNFSKENNSIILSIFINENNWELSKLLIILNNKNSGMINHFLMGLSPLQFAISYGKIDIVKLLIDNGADINLQNNNGNTALITAVENGHTDIVKLLIDNGADINHKNKFDITPLFTASTYGKIEILKLLIEKGASNINHKNKFGITPLITATSHDKLKTVKLLIDNCADINLTDNNKNTALITAAIYGKLEIVRLLIENNAKINLKNEDGDTALITAATYDYKKILKLLIDNGAINSHLLKNNDTTLITNYNNQIDIVKLLIDNGADINLQNNNGNTALITAVENGHTDIVKLLIDNGADINLQNNNGNTALITAVENGHTDIVKLLIDNGADINLQNNNGNTALITAVENGHTDIVKLLIDNGADNNFIDKNGNNVLIIALITAATYDYPEIIKLLLSKSIDINLKLKHNGNTALITAASMGNKETVKLLLDNGADVNITNKNGKNALYYTKCNDYIEITNILENFQNLKNKIESFNKQLEKTQNEEEKIKVKNNLKQIEKELETLLKIELSNVITQNNLGEISDNSSQTILNTLKKLNYNLDINQIKIQENTINNNTAIIETNNENYYSKTVNVKVRFKIVKKTPNLDSNKQTITEDEYKNLEVSPKGSQVISNQSSNNNNSNNSFDKNPSTSGTQQQKSNQKQQNIMYDVPSDNSCLFWSVATAYLLPVRNNNEEFKNRFIQLFGEENLKYLQLIQKLLKQYDLENNRNLNQLWYQNQIANNLVTNVFRNRVVDYIRDNLDNPTQINSQINQIETFRSAIQISENEININNYLERMRQSSSWGGQLEILAIGNLLGSNINVNNRNIFETNNPNANLQIFHVNENHYNFILLQNTNEENIINLQEKNIDIQKQQKLTEAEKPKTNIKILNKSTVNNNTNLSVNKPIKINIANSQETTIKKAINKYNALSKEEKQQKLNEINQHYQSLTENEQKAFKDKLKDVGLGLTSTGISGAGILGISKMTRISSIKGLSTIANYIKNSLSTTRTVVSSETGEALEMTPLLSESTVAEGLTAAETLSVTEGSTVVATEGAVIVTEAGTAAALAPETLGLSLVIGGLVIAGTAILWWINSDHTIVKHESHNQYNEIEKYYKFLAHDQLKLDININEWNKIKQIYQENSNNYQEFKNKIKSEINNFYKEDHSGWGGSIIDEDINTLINILYNHFQEINNHFSSNSNHGWKIVTNTIGSYFIIEEE